MLSWVWRNFLSSLTTAEIATKTMSRRIPKSRVELHIHLDGSVRLSTIWELSREKGLPLPGDGSFEALIDTVVCTEPSTLANFLKGFQYIAPAIQGDLQAIERVAYELCEDQSRNGIIYFETRFCPHLLRKEDSPITAEMIVQTVNKGLKNGERDFNIKARSILCCMIGNPEWCKDIVDLCDKYRDQGVVGIDIAGDEAQYGKGTDIKIPQEYIDAFQEAKKRGIHRTMHAGEAGSYAVVDKAIHVLGAERIGHGYHVLESESLYKEVKDKDVHLETCPHSSLLTGAVPQTVLMHPILRFAKDEANFSVNTDDHTITGTWLPDELKLLEQWGLTEVHFCRAAFNAARSSFLPEKEKKLLIDSLKKIYGIPS